ncbi:MAG: 4Fe-4S dicluster domain-containing protein [Desulfitobacterium hafniense]|nr:4Fe-4S dicluster domain-containing protein [Desulfitobacterium hafniense]
MARYGMIIDLRRCVGCYACVMACKAENLTPKGVSWNRLIVEEKGEYPKARMTFTPVLCNHCENPPCRDVCPTGATYKRSDGIVAVNQSKCIGCKYCMVACPYQARSIHEKSEGYFSKYGLTPLEQHGYKKHKKGAPSKCVFCYERVEQSKEPACVAACPTRARIFGDVTNPNSEISHLLEKNKTFRFIEELGTKPAVSYILDQAPKTERG